MLPFEHVFLTSLYPSSSGTIWISTLFILLPRLFVGSNNQTNRRQTAPSRSDSLTKTASSLQAGLKPKSQNPSDSSLPLTRQATASLWWSDRLFFLPTPWQPGPCSNYWPSKPSSVGHPWCIAVIKVVHRKGNIQIGHSNVIRSSIGCQKIVTK